MLLLTHLLQQLEHNFRAKIKSNLRRNLKINQQTKHQNPKINNNNNRLVIQNKENRCKHNHRNNPVKFLFIKKKLSKKIDFQNLFFLIVKSFKNLYKINMSSSTTKFHKTLMYSPFFQIFWIALLLLLKHQIIFMLEYPKNFLS